MAMLRERPVAEISLRDLSERVGLAKSGMLRYFDSKEAIFLEVLDRTRTEWLAGLTAELPRPATRETGAPFAEPFAAETAVAAAIAGSLARQPLLCELVSVTGGVLERNISAGFARTFRQRAEAGTDRLSVLIRGCLPELRAEQARVAASAVFVLVAGLWPYATPTAAVAALAGVPGGERERFAAELGEALANQLAGISARAAHVPRRPGVYRTAEHTAAQRKGPTR
ncbi:TetR family transcriptional regulator [Amycolatopsis antarctica]|uniref:TetR family transcriptional regulator n=2 Tax=Amycolatopsis antarctica TaxID=1854586 RepID=A0A263CWY4_9PSEU|nr:TetR family transcriptional regulator [Amycolatopsis antarctica]